MKKKYPSIFHVFQSLKNAVIRAAKQVGIPQAYLKLVNFALRSRLHYEPIQFATDGLITSHHFGGRDDQAWTKALRTAREEFAPHHNLYHEWRLWTACVLMRNVLATRDKPVFVECGVGMGMTLYLFLKYIENLGDLDLIERLTNSSFLEMDTFEGIDLSLVPEEILSLGGVQSSAYGGATLPIMERRFAPYPAVQLLPGSIPKALSKVEGVRPDFLHIDMNNPKPEVEALSHFMPLMSTGSVVLLDDYSFSSARVSPQRKAIDALMTEKSWPRILGLPTGQGLLVI